VEGCGILDELMASIFCIIPVQPSNSFVGSNPTRASTTSGVSSICNRVGKRGPKERADAKYDAHAAEIT
jgi:hypothetical protein